MGWLSVLLFSALVLVGLWRLARFDRAALQMVVAALLVAAAGYVWQGRPTLAGQPAAAPAREELPDSAFAEARGDLLGRFDSSARWLTIADSYHRRGDTRSAVSVIRAGLKSSPKDPDLWTGLGNALVIHGGGVMTPAAELAFRRASEISPDHPGPKFFYGLALAQGGRFEEAEAVWAALLATARPDAEWRPMLEERLSILRQFKAASEAQKALPR